MTPSQLRKQVERAVAAARAEGRPRRSLAALGRGDTPQRAQAARDLGPSIVEDDATFEGALARLRDPAEDGAVRLALLDAFQVQSFASRQFASRRPAWMAALRGLMDDADARVRRSALELLSHERDGAAQEVLLRGLDDTTQAKVPPDIALSLLSHDIHAAVYPRARALAAASPDEATRLAALRVLAADAASAPLFEALLGDRAQPAAARLIAVVALRRVAPERFRDRARAVVLAAQEDDDVRAASLTALAQAPAGAAPADEALARRVAALRVEGSPQVRRAARAFRPPPSEE